jgi:catechol 2,3-dioxygenase-like lactoylglutathione lyase family enzyme
METSMTSPRSDDSRARPAVHSVDEFVLGVPDLAEARRFYDHFGLDVREAGPDLALHTHGHPHRWATLKRADAKRLLWLSLGIRAEDAARFERHLATCGVEPIVPPAGAETAGLWLRGPDALPIQLRVAPKVSPSEPAPREAPVPCRNAGRAPSRRAAGKVRPLHLSHILLFSANVEAATTFYTEVLGLKLSDRSGSVIAFLHSPHGSDHHLIALAKSHGTGLHHSSWCVPTLDAVGLGARQMAEAGFARGWGVGRHMLGSNYFRYVQDPWGSYAEYSYDIDFVAASDEWPAADHPPEDALYVWGPDVPDDFVVNHEIHAA